MSGHRNFDSFDRTSALNDANNRFNHQQGYRQEKTLFSLFTTEAYNMHGVPMYYYVTTYDTNYEKIWGEDNNRRFVRKFKVMAYYELPPEDKVWNKFGIEGLDRFSLFISKRHFNCASQYGGNSIYIPKMADIIMADYNRYIYEITEVKEESGMFLQSKQYVWELIVKPFQDEQISMTDFTE